MEMSTNVQPQFYGKLLTNNHIYAIIISSIYPESCHKKAEMKMKKSKELLAALFFFLVSAGLLIYGIAKIDRSGKDGNPVFAESPMLTEIAEKQPENVPEPAEKEIMTYILNTNTHKFHLPDCASVGDMKDKNKDEYTGTRDGLIALGYEPCGKCNP